MSARCWSSTTRAWRAAAPGAILEAAGYEVVEAEDGLSALERYFVEKPDVVLLDLVMKGMYGLDVLDQAARDRSRRPRDRRSADVQTSSRELVAGRRRRGLPQQAGRTPSEIARTLVEQALARAHSMELTQLQQDALVELLNIGFGRAAASLSRADRPPRAARSAAGVGPSRSPSSTRALAPRRRRTTSRACTRFSRARSAATRC